MAPVGRQRERGIKGSSATKDRINKMVKKRLPLQRGRNSRLDVSYLYGFKFMRFLNLWEMTILGRKKSKKENQQKANLIKNMGLIEPMEKRSTTCFWRDPDANFCIICGDDQEVHLELVPVQLSFPDHICSLQSTACSLGQLHNHTSFKVPKAQRGRNDRTSQARRKELEAP